MSSDKKKKDPKDKKKDSSKEKASKKDKKKGADDHDAAQVTDLEGSDEDDGMIMLSVDPTPPDLFDFVMNEVRGPLLDLLYAGTFKAFQDTDEFINDTRDFNVDDFNKIENEVKRNEQLKKCFVYYYIYDRTFPGYWKFAKFCSDTNKGDLWRVVAIFNSLENLKDDYLSFMKLFHGTWDAVANIISKKETKKEMEAMIGKTKEIHATIERYWDQSIGAPKDLLSDEEEEDEMILLQDTSIPSELQEFVMERFKSPFVDLLYDRPFKDFQATDEFKKDNTDGWSKDSFVRHYIYNQSSPRYWKFFSFCRVADNDDLLKLVGDLYHLDECTDDHASFMSLLRGAWSKAEHAEKGSIISTAKVESKKIQAMIDRYSDEADANTSSVDKGAMDESSKKKKSKDKDGKKDKSKSKSKSPAPKKSKS